MIRPYLNEEERFYLSQDTLSGDLIRLHFSYKKCLRDSYNKYWIFGKPVLHFWINQTILKPINKQMKHNWEKSNGRHV